VAARSIVVIFCPKLGQFAASCMMANGKDLGKAPDGL